LQLGAALDRIADGKLDVAFGSWERWDKDGIWREEEDARTFSSIDTERLGDI
jgi:hypothetical protein